MRTLKKKKKLTKQVLQIVPNGFNLSPWHNTHIYTHTFSTPQPKTLITNLPKLDRAPACHRVILPYRTAAVEVVCFPNYLAWRNSPGSVIYFLSVILGPLALISLRPFRHSAFHTPVLLAAYHFALPLNVFLNHGDYVLPFACLRFRVRLRCFIRRACSALFHFVLFLYARSL